MTPPSRVRLLFVATGPRDGGPALDEELRAAEQSLRTARYGSAIELVPLTAARPADLVEAVMHHRPVLLHLTGRGTPRDGLLFRAADGGEVPVDADGLAKVLAAAAPELRLVTVTACWTRTLAERLAESVGCAIGIDREIEDSAATALSGLLYRAIASGYPVGTATKIAKAALEMYGVRDAETVVLTHAPSTDPAQRFVIPAGLMPSGPREARKPAAVNSLPLLRKSVTVVLTIDGTTGETSIAENIHHRLNSISEVRRISIRDL